MRPEKVFKRYDIRGKYPEEIDEEFAEFLGKSIGTFAQRNFDREVIVCRDNKKSSEPLKKALVNGLKDSGIKVTEIGVGPTDYAAWAGQKLKAISVQVTSSHMPLEFNGFKLMYPEGNGFVNEDLYQVQDIFRNQDFETGKGEKQVKNLLQAYKKELVDFAESTENNWDKKIVVDSLGGVGNILPELLEKLGAEVIDISEKETPYVNPPEPSPKNLENLEKAVKAHNADLGLSNDLDADRVTVYYKNRFLTGDEVFSILSMLVEGSIVASIDTSKALDELNKDITYTRVGDPFVMDKALEIDAELAGEPNGHYAFTEFVPFHSGILSAAIISGLDLEELLEQVPEYYVGKENIATEKKDEVITHFIDTKNVISDLDGVKFAENDAEVLVRPSGSSSKIRVIVESKDQGLTENTLEKAVEEIKSL